MQLLLFNRTPNKPLAFVVVFVVCWLLLFVVLVVVCVLLLLLLLLSADPRWRVRVFLT